MEKQAPSIGRILIAVGFALSCFGLLLFLWVAFGGPTPLAAKDYRVTAYFPEGSALALETDIRIGGVSVGKVKSIELAPTDMRVNGRDTTAAELEIKPEYAPINSDARAIVRQKTLQGEAYVELTAGTEPVEGGGEEAAVALGAAANVSDAEAEAAKPVPEGGELGIGAVEEATQFDEILNAFDEETRESARSLTATGAKALRGRGLDLSDGLGNIAPFLEDAEEITETVRAERPAVRGLVRDTGAVFESLAADDRALRGTVTGLEQTFGGLADAHEPLAESLQILPTFEREADLTLERLDQLGEKARPVVAKLLPVATDVPPTLASVRRLAPDLESALRQTEPLIKAAEKGLPALTGTIKELGPVFDALDPFLAEVNPVRHLPERIQGAGRDLVLEPAHRPRRQPAGDPGPARAAPRPARALPLQRREPLDPPDPPRHEPRQRLPAPGRVHRGPRGALHPGLRLQEHRLHAREPGPRRERAPSDRFETRRSTRTASSPRSATTTRAAGSPTRSRTSAAAGHRSCSRIPRPPAATATRCARCARLRFPS